MYKRWLLIGALLIALPVFAAEQAGIIKIAKGTVTIERGGQKLAAVAGTPVFAGDRIITGTDSTVGLTHSFPLDQKAYLPLTALRSIRPPMPVPLTVHSSAGRWQWYQERLPSNHQTLCNSAPLRRSSASAAPNS
jgi:hypothetical protein